jgi:hypothetical protein
MGYFLNIICEDLDNIKDVDYLNQKKQTIQEKLDCVIGFLNKINFTKYRFSTLADCRENPNEMYFYFLTNLTNMSSYTDEYLHFNSLPLTDDFRGNLKNQDNLFLVLVDIGGTEDSFLNILKRLGLENTKLLTITENNFTIEFINSLINKNKKKTFNIVYDRWSDDNSTYYANLYPANKPYYRYRIQVGLFRFYDLFNEIRNCNIQEVYENSNENYYYFINGDSMVHHFKEEDDIPLNDVVRKCFNDCSNFNIILLNEHEYEPEVFITFMENLSKIKNYDPKRLYILNNNSKLDLYKEKHNVKIQLFYLDFLMKFISRHLVEFDEPKFIEDKKGDFFLCHNRSPKQHRYALLCLLKRNNLLNEIDWSLLMGWYHRKENRHEDPYSYFHEIFDRNEIDYYMDEINFFNSIEIKKSKYEEDKAWFDDTSDTADIFWNRVYEQKSYENSYVNIVTESAYFPNEIHITEKSLKPFYFFQFPLFLSTYNHIKYLKERFEFDVFDDIIDHSYDNEPDNKKRLKMVFSEITRLNNKKEELMSFYVKNKQRFINNKNKVINISNSNRDSDFFMSLINKK